MLSVSVARDQSDFEIAARFVREFGEWDAAQVEPYGISPDEVFQQFHSENGNDLAVKFGSQEGRLYIAKWRDTSAGSIAFNVFDDDAVEIHKFYVNPAFRGRGIGKMLMRTALAEIGSWHRRTVLLHTTPYMRDAIKLYKSFGFSECQRFRETPDNIKPTDYFMSLTL